MKKFVVTPWEVKGKVNYEKLIKNFGIKPIDEKLLEKIKEHTKELHFMLRRKIFFAHRDLDWILKKFEEGEEFFLYTGRGPSGITHIGHLIPWIFTKWLQKKFKSEVYFQLTEDEKFLVKRNLSLEQTTSYAYDNILDIIACGFKPNKTFIFLNTEYSKTQYKIAIQIAKHITFSTVKAAFGFKNSSNIGIVFFPAMQAVPCFLPSILKGKNIPCLIPAAVDRDVFWRSIARYVAPKLGFYKPAQIHSKFVPGLQGEKMSASKPETCIFTTDTKNQVKKKILKAFTGGRKTIEEQIKKGGKPEICSVYQYYYFLFEPNDKKIKKIYEDCKSGKRICGDCKKELIKKVNNFLAQHQKRRKRAKMLVEKYIVRD